MTKDYAAMFIGFPSGQVTMITFTDQNLFNLSHFFSLSPMVAVVIRVSRSV